MSGSEDQEKESAPEEQSGDYRLPARLRDKLGEEDTSGGDWEPPKRSPVGAIITIIIILAVIAGGWLLFKNHQAQVKAEADRIAAIKAREKAVADSLAAERALADSLAAVARADSIAAFKKLPKWKQRQVIAAQAKAEGKDTKTALKEAAEEVPMEEGPFVLDAGQYLFDGPANQAAAALKAAGLDATVKTVGSGDNEVFHVYVGKYSTRSAAVKAANELIAKGTAPQARVVPAPK